MSDEELSEREFGILRGSPQPDARGAPETQPETATAGDPAIPPADTAPPAVPRVAGQPSAAASAPAAGTTPEEPAGGAPPPAQETEVERNLKAALEEARHGHKRLRQELGRMQEALLASRGQQPAGGQQPSRPPEPPSVLEDPIGAIEHRFRLHEQHLAAREARAEADRVRGLADMEDRLGQMEFGADYEGSIRHAHGHFARVAEVQLQIEHPQADPEAIREQASKNAADYLRRAVLGSSRAGEPPRRAIMRLAEAVGFKRAGGAGAPAAPVADPVARAKELQAAQAAARSLAQPGGQKAGQSATGPSLVEMLSSDEFDDMDALNSALKKRMG